MFCRFYEWRVRRLRQQAQKAIAYFDKNYATEADWKRFSKLDAKLFAAQVNCNRRRCSCHSAMTEDAKLLRDLGVL